jgi:hypothetical protein
MAVNLDINISVKRLNKLQQNRLITFFGVTSLEHYYKITIAISCIDFFISNIKERFLTYKNILDGQFQPILNTIFV